MRLFLIQIFVFAVIVTAFPQARILNGVIKDNSTQEPLANVNIKVNDTREGTFTSKDGKFSISIRRFPASLTISRVGYESLFYELADFPSKSLELVLRQSTATLKQVNIEAVRYNYLFKDTHFSVLDYEIFDDDLLLLVFRYQLKNTELILLSRDGDTLSVMPVPELKPRCLYKDFLNHVHYISTKGTAFQCVFNEQQKKMEFIYKTSFDSLARLVQPFLFASEDRLYFQEYTPDGFGKRIGFYDTSHHKSYIKSLTGETTMKNLYDDSKFNANWNQFVTGPASFSDDDFRANKLFYYQRINAPVVKLGENRIALFNFTDGVIEMMNKEGKIYRMVPIEFQEEPEINPLEGLLSVFIPMADWKWSGRLFIDEYYHDVYTTFIKNGMVQIKKIDLETGKLTRTFDVPLPFPEKIGIYKGCAFFLAKETGSEFEKFKLVKLRL
jgi:hypothetical protein